MPEDLAADPFAGTPYRVVRMLGEGGMGEVYEVEHEIVGKRLVAKVLRRELAEDAALVDRMRVEAQALGALCHPNIVEVTDFHRTRDARPFLVMERLEGRTLGEELRRRGALPAAEAIDIVRQLLRALDAAHRLGLVHRDIKLDNIFLHRSQTGERIVKVLDFGVTKVLSGRSPRGPAPPALPTADGAIVGTPRYVSPEQVRGKAIDHRADIYAAGLVLYALVCGRGPFDGLRRQEDLFIAHLADAPPKPSEVAAQPIDPELDAAILRAIEKDPALRYQSAEIFEAALAGIGERLSSELGFLPTEASPAPPSFVPSRVEVSPALDALPERTVPFTPGSEPTLREAGGPREPTPTEILKPPTPAAHSALPTRTADVPPPSRAPSIPAPAPATAHVAARPKAPVRVYAAAALAALGTSGLGLWLVPVESFAALAALGGASLGAALASAALATRLSR